MYTCHTLFLPSTTTSCSRWVDLPFIALLLILNGYSYSQPWLRTLRMHSRNLRFFLTQNFLIGYLIASLIKFGG